jgi:alpha-glucoside transport system permease protein
MTRLGPPERVAVGTPPQILLGEVAVIDDTGPPQGTRYRPLSWTRWVWLAPTGLLLGLVVLWPVAQTLYRALFARSKPPGWPLWQVVRDPLAQGAVVRTLLWTVGVPLVVVTLGYLLAVSLRRARLGGVATALLVAPMALPMVVTGITFRLLYHPDPNRGVASWLFGLLGDTPPLWLGPEWITFSLMSAFVWAWVGLAVAVFRAALDGFPHQLLDTARIEGASDWELFLTVRWPVLRPIIVLLFALVGVATARSFDLLLVTAPDSVRDDAAVLSWHIWQRSGEPATAAAFSLLWLLILAVWVALASWLGRQQWPVPIRLPERRPVGRRWWWQHRLTRRTGRPAATAVRQLVSRLMVSTAVLVWTVPVVVLVATSLAAPVPGATTGWPDALPGEAFAILGETPMFGALIRTGLLAVMVTTVVILVSAFAAYALVWLGRPGPRGTVVSLLLAAAVMPVQVLIGPVSDVTEFLKFSPDLTLILIHVAIGVPFTVLVFRQAFAAVPADRVRRARLPSGGDWKALLAVALPTAWPSVVALSALEFIQVWNDLVVSLLVGAQEVAGPVLLTQARQFSSSAGVLAAGSVVASLVPLVVVFLTRRHIVAALISGVVRR